MQVLERDASDLAADVPKLEARAVQLTQQLQHEEKVGYQSLNTCRLACT